MTKNFKNTGSLVGLSAGLEGGVNFFFTMSPLMATVAASSEFIQTALHMIILNITYDNSKDYPYIFNAIAFNCTSMEWMLIGHVRLYKQSKEAYTLAFKKILERCSSIRDTAQNHYRLE